MIVNTAVPPLAALRHDRGWSQPEVVTMLQIAAERRDVGVGVDVPMLSKWERGKKRPSPLYQSLLAELYDVPVEALGKPVLESMQSQLDVLRGHAEGLGRALDGRMKSAQEGTSVPPTLNRLERLLDDCRVLDDHHGSVVALRTVTSALLPQVEQAIVSVPRSERSRAVGLLARTTQLVGWLLIDVNQPVLARQFLTEARSASEETQDGELYAFAMGTYAHALCLEHKLDPALDALAAAERAARRTESTRTLAWIEALKSRAHAELGKSDEAERCIEAGVALLQVTPTRSDPPWITFFDDVRLAHWNGFSRLLLHDGAGALARLGPASDAIPAEFGRERAILYADIALAHAFVDAPDEAGGSIRLAMAESNGSPRLQSRLESVVVELERRGTSSDSSLASEVSRFGQIGVA